MYRLKYFYLFCSNKSRAFRKWLKNQEMAASVISKIEVLGYHSLQAEQEKFLKQFFENIVGLDNSRHIVNQAITCRKENENESRRCHYRRSNRFISSAAFGYCKYHRFQTP